MLAGIVHVMVRKRIRDGGVPPTLVRRIGVFWLGGDGSGFEMGDGCEGRDVKGGKRDATFRNGFLGMAYRVGECRGLDGEDWGRELIKAECVFLFKQIRVMF